MQNTFKITALTLAFALAACSNESGEEKAKEETSATPTETSAETPTAPDATEVVETAVNADLAYLEANKAKADVQVTESGLQYKVLTEGSGKSPNATSQVTVHYEGKLITGDIFDSTYKHGEPVQFILNQVIPGWTEALQLMQEGAAYELYIPFELGYGAHGISGSIPPFATLIFKVELISVDS